MLKPYVEISWPGADKEWEVSASGDNIVDPLKVLF